MHGITPELLISFAQSLPGCHVKSGLYLVATPIGHLSDISLRALAILSQVNLIACEDTRVTLNLLNTYSIKKPLLSYHDYNKKSSGLKLIESLKLGQSIALVSDAGTPLISDPGFSLVKACIDHDIYVTSIPGANAAITALTLSGLSSDRFLFLGFLPPKSNARQKDLSCYITYSETLIIYESPHRMLETLQDIGLVFGHRNIVVCRELTKKFEEIYRGTAKKAEEKFSVTAPKGECVILIEGLKKSDALELSDDTILKMLQDHTSKDAAEQLSEIYGISKKNVYQRIFDLKK